MTEHADGKLTPPAKVVTAELDKKLEAEVRAVLTERILRESGLETQVSAALNAIRRPNGADLAKGIGDLFARSPHCEWRDHIHAIVNDLTGSLKRAAP
jgi:hypothetical protein